MVYLVAIILVGLIVAVNLYDYVQRRRPGHQRSLFGFFYGNTTPEGFPMPILVLRIGALAAFIRLTVIPVVHFVWEPIAVFREARAHQARNEALNER